VISGEFYRIGPTIRLNLRLHETATGRLLSGAQASGTGSEQLDKALPATCSTLLAPLTAQKRSAVSDGETVPVSLSTAEVGEFSMEVRSRSGIHSCPTKISKESTSDPHAATLDPYNWLGEAPAAVPTAPRRVASGSTCALRLEPGLAQAVVAGTESFVSDMSIPAKGGSFEIAHHGYAVLVLSIGALLAGGALGGNGVVAANHDHIGEGAAKIVAGSAIAVAGLIGLLIDSRTPHGWALRPFPTR
jgi:hypothetical protein